MAKYSFHVSGSQLIVSLIPINGDVQGNSTTYLGPSFKIGNNKINLREFGNPMQSFLFTEIGEIGGEESLNLQDSFNKLTALTANFNGGGSAPTNLRNNNFTLKLVDVCNDELRTTLISNDFDTEFIVTYLGVGLYTVTLSPIGINNFNTLLTATDSSLNTNLSNVEVKCHYVSNNTIDIYCRTNGVLSNDINGSVLNIQQTVGFLTPEPQLQTCNIPV